MNNTRRNEIQQTIQLAREAQAAIEALRESIEALRDEEQEYMENIPENLQNSDRYYVAEAAFDNLDEAVQNLEDIDIESVIANLEAAAE